MGWDENKILLERINMADIFPVQFLSALLVEKRDVDTVAVSAVAKVLETMGLSIFLTYWGTRTNPFE
jgi:hypothetical protein